VENFYRSVLEETDTLAEATSTEGLSDEVALLRVLLRRQLAERPENVELTLKGLHLLVRMVVAQFRLAGVDSEQMEARTQELIQQMTAIFLSEEAGAA